MKIILLGAPGSGKGTQSKIISTELDMPIISTGNILRNEVSHSTDLGLKAKEYMSAGKLVPDSIMIDMLLKHIMQLNHKSNYILDGFPRTISQAKSLENSGQKIDFVIEIKVSDEEILDRLSFRIICPKCGTPYNTKLQHVSINSKCINCSTSLVQRKDDVSVGTVKERLRIFYVQTDPVRKYYENKKIYFSVDGSASVESVSESILSIIRRNK